MNNIFKNEIKNNPPKYRNKINIMITNNDINTKLELQNSYFNIKEKQNKDEKKAQDISINNNVLDKIVNYNDYELNNLSYNEALNLDKRTYFQ